MEQAPMMMRKPLVLLVTLALAACGDPGPDADRGYVKPPLETPGLVVRGEEPSDMTRYGEPVAPRVVEPEDVLPADETD